MKTNYIFCNNNKFNKKSRTVLHFCSLFNIWLNERQLHSPICFCVQPDMYVVLTEVHEENSEPHKYVLSKSKHTLTHFSYNCGQSSLVSHWNFTRDGFLKAMLQCEIWNHGSFPYVGLPCPLNASFISARFCNIIYWTLTTSISHLIPPNVTLHYTVTKNQNY
jgi:hypothetical protein